MDRGERRWRERVVKTRRRRFYYEYWGLPAPWFFNGELQHPLYFERGWYVRPWQVNGRWLFSTPGRWVNTMMTQPARAEQARALHDVVRSWDMLCDDDLAWGLQPAEPPRWPDYKRPHVYYW